MSKWRPAARDCLYVIGDIHGQLNQLRLISKRIFPLRKSDGGKDRLVILGDYIDRLPESHLVVDFLIAAKKKYKNQLILLRGNHEQMLLDAINTSKDSSKYMQWMRNGGEQTLLGYLNRAGEDITNPYEVPRFRVADYIPKEHIEFFKSLPFYYETDNYIFVHAGCDPTTPMINQSTGEMIWDRELFQIVIKECVIPKIEPDWDKTLITGHNGNKAGQPLITKKFMMLDCSYAQKLLVVELNSMEAFEARKDKDRLVKVKLLDRIPV